MNRVDLQPCYILKTQAYKETSVIHQVFSLDYGVVSIISKGSRLNTSKRGSLLQAHRALLISWSGKGELKTLTAVEERLPIAQLKGTALYCGFYVNELLLNFLHKHDAHAELFNGFATVIAQLSANTALEANLRQFEKLLLNEIGYGLLLEYEVDTQLAIQQAKSYRYQLNYGAIACEDNHPEAILGSTLINLQLNKLSDKNELQQAKRLMRKLIDAQLNGKVLKSRELFI